MARFAVTGYRRRIAVMMRVEAESADEAIEKAKRREYHSVDTEPDRDGLVWTAALATPPEGTGR